MTQLKPSRPGEVMYPAVGKHVTHWDGATNVRNKTAQKLLVMWTQ